MTPVPRPRYAARLLLLASMCAPGGTADAATAPGLAGTLHPAAVQERGPSGTLGSSPDETGPVELVRESWQMGTRLRVELRATSRELAVDATEAVFREVSRLEELLSTWSDASELSELNRAPVSRQVAVDPELLDLLVEAEGWARRTGRAVDPTVGALVDLWDLRGEGHRPGEAEVERALEAVGARAFEFGEPAGTATRLHPAAWIDAGAFGKGAALRSAGRILRRRGIRSAILDFGGQLLFLGEPWGEAARTTGAAPPPARRPGRSPEARAALRWSASVAHPFRRHEPALRLHLPAGDDLSLATSGASERVTEVDGERVGHLLDPGTGRPVPAWGSVTVVHTDPLVADLLATALFVLGPDEGRRWAEVQDGIAALFLVEREGAVLPRWTPALEPFMEHPAGVASDGQVWDGDRVPHGDLPDPVAEWRSGRTNQRYERNTP